MSEIEKLYKNAGVEKVTNFECTYDYGIACPNDDDTCENCGYYKEKEPSYPPFTAEKQLSLIKWLMVNTKDYQYDIEDNKNWFYIDDFRETKYREFNEALAELINLYWQDLTEEERTDIAEILK